MRKNQRKALITLIANQKLRDYDILADGSVKLKRTLEVESPESILNKTLKTVLGD